MRSSGVLPGSSAEYQRLATDRERWRTSRGELEIWIPRPAVIVIRFSGHGDNAFVEPIVSRVQRAVDSGVRPSVFDDWERALSYDPRARLEMTRYAMSVRDRVRATHVLVRSKLLSMTVSLVNRALDNRFRIYSDRQEFECALGQALAAADAAVVAARSTSG